MSCTKHNHDCGCNDNAYKTPFPCPPGKDCPEKESCGQIYDMHCIVYNGDEIVDLDIKKGDRMDEILQKLLLNDLNPGCVNPTSSCKSVLNLRSIVIATTSIQVEWDIEATAVNGYRVEWKLATAGTWTLNAITTLTTDAVGPLLPDTEYHIRVAALCSAGTCYSLTILVKTLPTT